MFSDSSTAAATFAALLMVFVPRGVSGQSTSLTPTLSVTLSSMSTLPTSSQDISTTTTSATAASTEVMSSTPSGLSTNASVTTMNPTSEATTEAPTTTEAPSTTKTCGWVIVVWKKSWKSMYKDNQQFISNTTEKLQMLLEHGLFNDSSKYGHVKVSDLQVNDKDGDVNVTFKLCLVLKSNAHAGYIEDVIKMWKKFGNESITGHEFQAEVTFKDWKAKDGECSKCSSGGAGPMTLERECKPKKAEYSCAGVRTTVESQDCLKYCDSKAATLKFTSVFLLLAVLISFSASFTIWE